MEKKCEVSNLPFKGQDDGLYLADAEISSVRSRNSSTLS